MVILIIVGLSLFGAGMFIGGLLERNKLLTELAHREQQQKIQEMWSKMFQGGKNE